MYPYDKPMMVELEFQGLASYLLFGEGMKTWSRALQARAHTWKQQADNEIVFLAENKDEPTTGNER